MIRAGLFLAVLTVISSDAQQPAAPPTRPGHAHVANTFHFVVHAPLSRAAPLFGPDGERSWGGKNWNPEFVYPSPGQDIEGAVFTVSHGHTDSVWVNTVFDLAGGRMQYVSFVPDMVSMIDVRLTPVGAAATSVEVTYRRTALNPAANPHVEALGKSDSGSGPDWQQAIEACLKGTAPHSH